MFRSPRSNLVLAGYGLLISISAFVTALVIFQIPSDPENRMIFGLSLQRLALIGGILFIGMLAAGFATKAYRDGAWAGRIWVLLFDRDSVSMRHCLGALAGFVLSWIAACTPSYRYGTLQDYFVRNYFWIMHSRTRCMYFFRHKFRQ